MTTPLLNADIYLNGSNKPFIKFRKCNNNTIKINMEFNMANVANLTDEQVKEVADVLAEELVNTTDLGELTEEEIEAIINSALKNPMA